MMLGSITGASSSFLVLFSVLFYSIEVEGQLFNSSSQFTISKTFLIQNTPFLMCSPHAKLLDALLDVGISSPLWGERVRLGTFDVRCCVASQATQKFMP